MLPNKPDIIYIRELQLQAVIGIYDWEQRFKQTISINLELAVDFKSCFHSQRVEDTINYETVVNQLTELITSQPFSLLEVMANQAADFMLRKFPVSWIRIQICKLGALANVKEVGVILERYKAPVG